GLTSGLVTLLALGAGAPALGAAVAGAWFAAMPEHVESVAWISGRTDGFSALLFALALVLDRTARSSGRAWPGVGATLALLLGLLCKEAALAFVVIVAVAEWVECRGRGFEL